MEFKDYYKKILSFTNSIVFKWSAIQIYMDNNIEATYGIKSIDPQNSKYYLNLNGERHQVDPIVYYTLPDDSIIELTKENVLLHNIPNFTTDLNIYSRYISKYPSMSLYIKSVFNPVSFTEAYHKVDGEIINYDKTYITNDNISIIKDIEDFIKSYIISINRRYTTDILYIPAALNNLYALLPLYIVNSKWKHIFTIEAMDDDIENHIMSFNYVDKSHYDWLNRDSLLWLYGNISYIKTNIGSNKILKDIIDNIYDTNNIGIGKIIYNKLHPELNNDAKIDEPTYEQKYIFTTKPVNNSHSENDIVLTMDNIKKLEEDIGYIDKHIPLKEKDPKYVVNNKADTKVFKFNDPKLYYFYMSSIANVLVSTIGELVRNNHRLLEIEKKFLNPGDRRDYIINGKQAYFLFLTGFLRTAGVDISDLRISDIKLGTVYNKQLNIDAILDKVFYKEIIKDLYMRINPLLEPNYSSMTIDTFKTYIDNAKSGLFKIIYYIANSNDVVLESDIRYFFDTLFTEKTLYLDDSVTYLEYIKNNYNLTMPIDNQEPFNTCKEVIDQYFGVSIDEVYDAIKKYNKYLKLIKKYTSYTVHFIFDKNIQQLTYLYKTTNNVLQQHINISELHAGYYKKYDNNTSFLTTTTSLSNNINNLTGFLSYEIKLLEPLKLNILASTNEIYDLTLLHNLKSVVRSSVYTKYSTGAPRVMTERLDRINSNKLEQKRHAIYGDMSIYTSTSYILNNIEVSSALETTYNSYRPNLLQLTYTDNQYDNNLFDTDLFTVIGKVHSNITDITEPSIFTSKQTVYNKYTTNITIKSNNDKITSDYKYEKEINNIYPAMITGDVLFINSNINTTIMSTYHYYGKYKVNINTASNNETMLIGVVGEVNNETTPVSINTRTISIDDEITTTIVNKLGIVNRYNINNIKALFNNDSIYNNNANNNTYSTPDYNVINSSVYNIKEINDIYLASEHYYNKYNEKLRTCSINDYMVGNDVKLINSENNKLGLLASKIDIKELNALYKSGIGINNKYTTNIVNRTEDTKPINNKVDNNKITPEVVYIKGDGTDNEKDIRNIIPEVTVEIIT